LARGKASGAAGADQRDPAPCPAKKLPLSGHALCGIAAKRHRNHADRPQPPCERDGNSAKKGTAWAAQATPCPLCDFRSDHCTDNLADHVRLLCEEIANRMAGGSTALEAAKQRRLEM
jgi:hypothetical protein